MDTQAMTYGGKSTPSDIEAQRAKIPDVKPKQINLISDALKKELKLALLRIGIQEPYHKHPIQCDLLNLLLSVL